jgi:hypothetical protein
MPPAQALQYGVENWSRERLPKSHSIMLPDHTWSRP